MIKVFWRVILCFLAAVFFCRPALAEFKADLFLTSPYYGLREIGTVETDLIYQAYGATLHGEYTGEKSAWQIGMDYTYAAQDLGGRDIKITAKQLVLKYPRDKEEGSKGTSIYYWTLSYREDEIAVAGTTELSASTVLLGFEIYSTAKDSGMFTAGAGVGWREQAMPSYTASGFTASLWFDFSVELKGQSELRFSTATTWSQPETSGYKIMEKDTITRIGWGIGF